MGNAISVLDENVAVAGLLTLKGIWPPERPSNRQFHVKPPMTAKPPVSRETTVLKKRQTSPNPVPRETRQGATQSRRQREFNENAPKARRARGRFYFLVCSILAFALSAEGSYSSE